jgi:hypothetical protein
MFNIPRKLTFEESSIQASIMKPSYVDRDPAQSTTSDSDSPVDEPPFIKPETGGGPWQLQQERTHKTLTADVSYNLCVEILCI